MKLEKTFKLLEEFLVGKKLKKTATKKTKKNKETK
jgi:hypothetical protein